MLNTNRIKINTKDNSKSTSYLISSTESRIAGTSIKGLKGSGTPIRIKAGEIDRFYEIFGTPNLKTNLDASIQQLECLELINNGYDIYVNSYISSGKIIPIYDTNIGLIKFYCDNNNNKKISLNSSDITNLDESPIPSEIENINLFSNDIISVIVPMGASNRYFNDENINAGSISYSTKSKGFEINLGFDWSKRNLAGLDLSSSGNNILYTLQKDISKITEIKLCISYINPSDNKYKTDELNLDDILKFKGSNNEDYYYNPLFNPNSTSTEEKTSIFIADDFIKENVEDLRNSIISQIYNNISFYYIMTLKTSSIHFTYIPKYFNDNDTINISLSKINIEYPNKRTLALNSSYNVEYNKSYIISYNSLETDSAGVSLNFRSKLQNQEYIIPVLVKEYSQDESQNNFINSLSLSFKGTEYIEKDSSKESGWQYYIDNVNSNLLDITLFVDFSCHQVSNVSSSGSLTYSEPFNGLGNTLSKKYQLARFVYNVNLDPSIIPSDTDELSQLSLGERFYTLSNQYLILDTTYGGYYWSTGLGAYVKMLFYIDDTIYGGRSPSFINEDNMGGQLGVSYIKLRYSYNADEQEMLNNANINVIVEDKEYSSYVAGAYTNLSGGGKMAKHYIHTVSSVLLAEREIRQNVLVPQIDKPNNAYYRRLRGQQTWEILNPRKTSGIWTAISVDTSENVNTEDVQEANQFIVDVRIHVANISEEVILNLTTEAKSSDVDDGLTY